MTLKDENGGERGKEREMNSSLKLTAPGGTSEIEFQCKDENETDTPSTVYAFD